MVGVAIVCAHGAFRVPENLFLDEQEASHTTGFMSFIRGVQPMLLSPLLYLRSIHLFDQIIKSKSRRMVSAIDLHRHPPPLATPHEDAAASSPKLLKKLSSAVTNCCYRTASPTPKASDALTLSLYLTNVVFFMLFFSVAYYLLHRWHHKIWNSTPLHVVTLFEIAAIMSLVASFIYLLGFFGVDFVQSFISHASPPCFLFSATQSFPWKSLVH